MDKSIGSILAEIGAEPDSPQGRISNRLTMHIVSGGGWENETLVDLVSCLVVEVRDLRAQLARVAAQPRTVYVTQRDGMEE